MARKEDKQPQYLPLIVKAKLHTGGRDYEKIKEELKGQGFTCKQMKGMVREGNYFDGIVLYLSKWNWDNHESWHLYNWDDKDDKEVMLGIYEAEQYHPQAPYRYRDNFEKFQKDWTSGEYDPGMTFTFKDSEVEVLEVLQEEVDNIDHEAVKRQVAAAEDTQYQKRRKQRQRRKQASIAFLIEVVKALVTFFTVCVGLGILYLVFVVVREVGWEVRRQNREKHEQEDKEE